MAKNGCSGYQDSAQPDWCALAARQYGYLTRPQLLAFGLTSGTIRHLIAAARLIPVHTGVYALGHVPATPVARAFAAVLACGDTAVLSHGSAATLWSFNRYWDRPAEVTVASSHRRRPGIKVHRSRTLSRRDVTRQLGVPVTAPARTVLDVAPQLTDKRLTRVVNDARHAGLLHLDALADVVHRDPNHPGAGRLKPFVENPANPTRSPIEDEFVAFAKRYGLPAPVINAKVHGHDVDVLFGVERSSSRSTAGSSIASARTSKATATATRTCPPPGI